MRNRQGSDIGVNFGGHKALFASSVANQHDLTRPQLRHAEPAKSLHMHKDVLGSLPAGKEAKAIRPVEPFDQRPLKPAFRRYLDMSAGGGRLPWMDAGRCIHGHDFHRLIAAVAPAHQADHPRALKRGLVAILAKTGRMQKNVADSRLVRQHESIAFGDIEPFDRAGYFNHAAFARLWVKLFGSFRAPALRDGLLPHPNAPSARLPPLILTMQDNIKIRSVSKAAPYFQPRLGGEAILHQLRARAGFAYPHPPVADRLEAIEKRKFQMRYLHTMVRVTDVDKSLDFWCNKLGMEEVRRHENEQGRFTLIFLAAPKDKRSSATNRAPELELTFNWDPETYGGGRNFGHLAYKVDDIYATCRKLMDAGVTINRPPRDGNMAFVRSPDGISVELLQEGEPRPPAEPWASMENTGSW